MVSVLTELKIYGQHLGVLRCLNRPKAEWTGEINPETRFDAILAYLELVPLGVVQRHFQRLLG